jgi:hypothetical protein
MFTLDRKNSHLTVFYTVTTRTDSKQYVTKVNIPTNCIKITDIGPDGTIVLTKNVSETIKQIASIEDIVGHDGDPMCDCNAFDDDNEYFVCNVQNTTNVITKARIGRHRYECGSYSSYSYPMLLSEYEKYSFYWTSSEDESSSDEGYF